MEPLVIEVLGVPHHDRMADQLKIHFLKRRNKGGDVLTVIYPTSTPGQAYVVFESQEVPGVLEYSHILDVDNSFYPIHVKKAHLSEVDMPVETMLDLSMFSDQDSVMKLLKYYDFKVKPYSPGHLHLKGSFLKLKLVRNELVRLQSRSHSKRSSVLHNGSALGYDVMGRNSVDPKFDFKSTSRNIDQMDRRPIPYSASSLSSSYRDSTTDEPRISPQTSHSSYTERNMSSSVDVYRRSPLTEGASSSLSGYSPSSLALVHHTSPPNKDFDLVGYPRSLHSSYYSSIGSTSHTVDTDIPNYLSTQQQQVTGNEMYAHRRSHLVGVSSSSRNSRSSVQDHTSYGSSASGGSPRSRPNVDGDTWASSSLSSPSSSSGRMETFLVDTDTLNFILTQKQDVVKSLKTEYGIVMTLIDDNGCTIIKLLGNDCEKAKSYLQDTINGISLTLRTQEINLKTYDHAAQTQIRERIQRFKDSGVLITESNDVVKLVGPSIESFEVKQKILGQDDNPHRGRTKERSLNSRSSSVPRHYKQHDRARTTAHQNQASAPSEYCPSRYQDESDKGKGQHLVQGHEQTPDKNSQRTRSSSEFQDKNSPTSQHPELELMSSSQAKKPSKHLIMHQLKRLDPSKLKIKRK